MPLATDAYEPLPVESRTLTGMIGDENATPATPTPLFVAAPTMPATCVPWPLSSAAELATQVPVRQFAPDEVWTRPLRSGCDDWTPVSTTASGAPPVETYEPGYDVQPPTASIFENPHCEPNDGSFGAERVARAMKFGSA